MVIALAYWVVTIFCWAYALRYGGKTGLWAFLLFVGMTAGTMAATWREPLFQDGINLWRGINLLLVASDGMYFVGLMVLALNGKRYWPIWSAGLALAAVLTHFGAVLDTYSSPKLYRGLATIWQFPIFLTMVIGIAKDRKYEQRDVSTRGRDTGSSRNPDRLTG